jgi:adenylosuccinate synthase
MRELNYFPPDANTLSRCRPVYETFPGWRQSTAGITKYQDLPKPARAYLARIEELSEAEAQIISTGPARNQTITRADPFA